MGFETGRAGSLVHTPESHHDGMENVRRSCWSAEVRIMGSNAGCMMDFGSRFCRGAMIGPPAKGVGRGDGFEPVALSHHALRLCWLLFAPMKYKTGVTMLFGRIPVAAVEVLPPVRATSPSQYDSDIVTVLPLFRRRTCDSFSLLKHTALKTGALSPRYGCCLGAPCSRMRG